VDIRSAVVHLLRKDRQGPAEVIERPDEGLLEINDDLLELVGSLRKLYSNKTGRGYGEFIDDEDNYPFSRRLSQYLDGADDLDFLSFSKLAMSILETKIKDVRLATGGYLLFAEYVEEDGNHSLIVASIKDRPGLAFDDKLNLTDAMHLDLDRLHEMAKVDISRWQQDGEKYLSFAKSRSSSSEHSEYFQNFIGCEELASAKAMNEYLVEAVRKFGDECKMSPDEQKNLRGIVLNYCQEKLSSEEQVDLVMLSQRISEDEPEKFIEFLNDHSEEYPISNHFDPVKSVFKKLRTLKVRMGDVHVQFSVDSFGTLVDLDDNNCLIIKELPAEFVEELRRMK
jgi:nucleoid-associated protein